MLKRGSKTRMLDKIENQLRKEGRKQRGKKKLQNRRNIIPRNDYISLIAKKDLFITLDQFKIIKLDLSKIFSSAQITFKILPNHSFTKKGLLIRMGKGKGKLDYFGTKVGKNTIIIEIKIENKEKDIRSLLPFFKKYPFLTFK